MILKKKQDNYYCLEGDWCQLDLPNNQKKYFYDLFPKFRIDAFFNGVYNLIIKYKFQNKGLVYSRKEVLNYYYLVCQKYLKDIAFIFYDPFEDISDSTLPDWENYFVNYGKELKAIIDTFLDVLNYDSDLKISLNIDENENVYTSQKAHTFLQSLVIASFHLAKKRIEDEFNNQNFFGVEILNTNQDNGKKELVLYMTPLGMEQKFEEHFRGMDKELHSVEFNKILSSLNIKKVKNNSLKELCDSNFICYFEDGEIYHTYKQNNLSLNDFFTKRVNKGALMSLLVEFQANLKSFEKSDDEY